MGVSKNQIFNEDSLRRVKALCKLGARPPVIRALMPSFPEAFVSAVWEGEQGRRPPRGPLPHTVTQYLDHAARRLHSSFFLTAFHDLREKGIHDTDAIIVAYQRYMRMMDGVTEEPIMSLDRAWVLVRDFVKLKSIKLVTCPNCGTRYVHSRDELVSERNCPVRRLVPDYTQYVSRRRGISPARDIQKPAAEPVMQAQVGEAHREPSGPNRTVQIPLLFQGMQNNQAW